MRSIALALLMLVLGHAAACSPARSATWTQATGAINARSVEGRPIHTWTLRAQSSTHRAFIIGGIHGDETEALAAMLALRHEIAGYARVHARLVEDANPDGTKRGTRGNAHGVDLNRNWPTANFAARPRHGPSPLSEPETRFLHEQIVEFRPCVIIVFHSARNGPFVNFDGPAEHLAEAFARAAVASDPRWHVRASMGYPTPGSLGTWAGVERKIPILTVEFARGHNPARVERAVVEGTIAVFAAITACERCKQDQLGKAQTPRPAEPRTRSSV